MKGPKSLFEYQKAMKPAVKKKGIITKRTLETKLPLSKQALPPVSVTSGTADLANRVTPYSLGFRWWVLRSILKQIAWGWLLPQQTLSLLVAVGWMPLADAQGSKVVWLAMLILSGLGLYINFLVNQSRGSR